MSNRVINPNLKFLHKSLKEGKTGAILEGSSRSGKTWSSVDFIVYLCSTIETGATINIIKETYNSFKTTLYEDFNRRLPMYGIKSPFSDKQEVAQFKLFGNQINLLGADKESKFHGAGCDYFYVNEALDVSNAIFDQAEQRCRKFWWMDYNPKATEHWIFNKVCNRAGVSFLKTTFLDNPFVSANEKRKILSYEPTHPEDRHLPVDKRRPHPINIAQGTADDYMWNVYGLGLRSAPEGLIFPNVEWIDKFPENLEKIYYGSDIGQTESPSTVAKVGIDKLATVASPGNMYIECLAHEPTPSTNDYIRLLNTCVQKNTVVWADSAEPGYISAARQAGMQVLGVNKFPGSIMYGIGIMKNYKIHLVKNQHYQAFLKEQTNYKKREVNGIKLDEPIDDHNHIWDGARYAVMSNIRQ